MWCLVFARAFIGLPCMDELDCLLIHRPWLFLVACLRSGGRVGNRVHVWFSTQQHLQHDYVQLCKRWEFVCNFACAAAYSECTHCGRSVVRVNFRAKMAQPSIVSSIALVTLGAVAVIIAIACALFPPPRTVPDPLPPSVSLTTTIITCVAT